MDVNSSLDNYKNNLIKKVKKLFGVEDATCLKLGLKSYCDNILNEQKLQNQKFYDFVNNNLNYDDYDAINNLSKFCIHLYIEDYNNDKTNELMDSLMKIKNQFMKIDNSFEDYMIKLNFTKETLSPMGNLFKNSLVSTIEEYAESIDKDEKIAILSEILKDLM
jgi:hypothetical protein